MALAAYIIAGSNGFHFIFEHAIRLVNSGPVFLFQIFSIFLQIFNPREPDFFFFNAPDKDILPKAELLTRN